MLPEQSSTSRAIGLAALTAALLAVAAPALAQFAESPGGMLPVVRDNPGRPRSDFGNDPIWGERAADGSVRTRISVSAIDLDASVTTTDGTPVEDLRGDEVLLRIDGNPVALDYFTRVSTALLLGPGGRRAGADESGLVARQFFIVLDEDHLQPRDRPGVFAAARSLLDRLGPSDRLAIALLERGRLRLLSPFGAPRESAASAIDARRSVSTLGALGVPSVGPEMAIANEQSSYRLLARAVRGFGSYPGRKEMVLISRGLEHDGARLVRAFDGVVQQANRSRVTIHTVGAAGIAGGGGVIDTIGQLGVDRETGRVEDTGFC